MNSLQTSELHERVLNGVINPSIEGEVVDLMGSRDNWRKIYNITEALGHILIVVSTVFAFAAGVYNELSSLAFVSGCVSTISISLLKFSDYAAKESNERTSTLNKLLDRLDIKQLPKPINIGIAPIDYNVHPPTPNNNYYMSSFGQ